MSNTVRMLEVRHLSKRFSGVPAVDDVTFVAASGEVTGYLGPNGSGKSTTIKMITGLLAPSEGEILFGGAPIQRDLIAHRRRIGYVPEEPHLYTHLTGQEYLELAGQLHGIPDNPLAAKISGLLRLFSLHGNRDVALADYSKGMRQKILLSAALLHNPDLIILDEPFSGLDIHSALVLRSLIQALAGRGKVVLLSSHEMDVIEKVCSRVVILHKGRVVANDSIGNLRELMAVPTLEQIFAQLAVEQDSEALSRKVLEVIEG